MYHETFDITLLKPSPTNPRQHFDPVKLAELASSLKEHGVLEPLIVRKFKGSRGQFEIVAGERRFRAATLAELKQVPVLERELTDEQVIEIQLIENIQRDDLTALEQARGYRALIDSNPDKHTAASIATRVGMSEAWVWDRLKLNDLIGEAKTLLEQGKMAVGHAILLARLKPADQARAINPEINRSGSDGLWQADHAGLDWDEDAPENAKRKPGKYDGLKAVSVRELEKWIAEHIRFDVAHAAKAVPLEFAPVAEQIQAAEERPGRGKKVIPITFDYHVQDSARDPVERTYGVQSWQRADGKEQSKTCEHSVLGVVAAGSQHYGKTLEVCIARDKCRVHFGKVIAQKEKNAKLRDAGHSKKAATAEKRQESAFERQQREQQVKHDRWSKLGPAFERAIEAAAKKQTRVKPALLIEALKQVGLPVVAPAQLPKMLLLYAISELNFQYYGAEKQVLAWAKRLGVDAKAIAREALKPDTEPKKAKTAA